jgi:hypothetical protein
MIRSLRLLIIQALAILFSAVTTNAAAQTPRQTVAPNWDHVRTIGGRLGVPRTVTVGDAPARTIAVGDFDGDGNADLAIVDAASGRVTVLRGDGLGGFRSAALAAGQDWATVDAVTAIDGTTYRAASSAVSSSTTLRAVVKGAPQAVARSTTHRAVVADFNGDGIVDLAAAESGSSALEFHLGEPNGGSQPASRSILGGGAVALASGDFDGDGAIDLFAADGRSSTIAVLLGDGRGNFDSRRTIDVGVAAAADGLAASDVDGDGLADLAVIGEGADALRVYLSTRGASTSVPRTIAVEASSLLAADAADYEGIVSLALSPSTIAGGSGATSTATITLNAPAPPGGVVVSLASSNPELAVSVASITVPEGAMTATVVVGTNANYRRYSALAFDATISGTHGTTTRSAVLSLTAQARPGTLSSFDVQNQGQMCLGVGVRQSTDGITLEFGSAGNLFDCVPSNLAGQDGTCTFRQECALGCERRPPSNGSQFSDVCATTAPFPIAVNPKLVVGGNGAVASLQLNAPAPANSSGVVSSLTVLANTIPNISMPIPAGATMANAEVLTARVIAPQFAPIDASYYTPRSDGSVGGRIGLTWLALVPGTPPPFSLRSFEFDPVGLASVSGGTSALMVAQMNQVAPAPEVATATMTLTSSHPAIASFPQPEVAFTQGSSGRGVFVQTQAVAADTLVTLSATVGTTTLTRTLTVRATPPATRVNSFFLDPFDVQGGNPATGLVVLNGAAPAGGAVVTLSSANTAAVTMPASVTVPAGSDRVSFTISTSPVPNNTSVALTARFNGTFAATSLIVTPAPGAATLTSLTVSPISVVGGHGATGTVTLSAAAPGGGAVINLSRGVSAANVPATVTVAAGAQSATFPITTTSVTTSTPVTITATYGSTSRSATLTVTPASQPTTPPPPTLVSPSNGATVPLPATLDWNNVTGAASYQIHVDDSSSFSSPRVVEQIVATSQFTVSSLAIRQHWWRVRGVNSAGTAGAWSAVRSFTPQAATPPPGTSVTLTVSATGRSGERVTSTPAGINVAVGSTGSASFTSGTQITLSVSNGRDAIWSGGCSSGGNKRRTCTFTINGNVSVSANVQ